MRIKAIYRKNLKMSEGKIAAQIAHSVKNLGPTPKDCNIIVLKVSDKKFFELIEENKNCYIQVDKGLTEVEPDTITAAAWIEENYFIMEKVDEFLNKLQEDLEPYKNTLVIDGVNNIVRLVDVIDGEDDYYWVYDTKKGKLHSSCVIGWVPLKGFLPQEEYIRLVNIWNLNNIEKAV